MTLYWTTRDAPGQSNITGNTLANWPVFAVSVVVLPSTLNAADFGFITRADGTKQTTYKGWPLYYWVNDKAAGDILGDGLAGVWSIVNPVAAAPAPMPTLSISSPASGASLPAGNIAINTAVTNFNVADKQGQPNIAGEGHLHFYLDVDAPISIGQPAVPASGVWAHVSGTTNTFTNVEPGTHTISVQLVNNDHTPVIPLVVTKITITVTSFSTVSTTPSTTTTTTTGDSQKVNIDLTAQGFAFDKSTITVQAGVNVTINFNNKDSGIPHNFALYTNSSATTQIFVGQIINGPATTVYTFKAPAAAGTYFFRCDRHPTTMTGSFIVTAASSGGGY